MLVAVGLAGALSGCKMADKSAAPMDSNADVAQAQQDPLARLDQLEGEMRAFGLEPTSRDKKAEGGDFGEDQADRSVAPAADDEAGEADMVEPSETEAPMPDAVEAEPAAAAQPVEEAKAQERRRDEATQRCESLCSLNVAICELETSICSLAQDHGDDPTYADACERATDDCSISSQACDACEA